MASQALAPQCLPQRVADFRRAHPLLEFQVRIGDHVQALQALRAFETDIALVFNLSPEPDVEMLAQFEQRLVATMQRSHPLAQLRGRQLPLIAHASVADAMAALAGDTPTTRAAGCKRTLNPVSVCSFVLLQLTPP